MWLLLLAAATASPVCDALGGSVRTGDSRSVPASDSGAVAAALASGGDPNAPCRVPTTVFVNRWRPREVVLGVLFPLFGLAKVLGGGRTETVYVEASPLAVASGAGDLEVVRLLLDHGATPDGSGREKATPLALAVAAASVDGNDAVAALLLDRGASPRVARLDGPTVVRVMGRAALLQRLRGAGLGPDDPAWQRGLEESIDTKNLAVAKEILGLGVVPVADVVGTAAARGDVAILTSLLDAGGPADATSLARACQAGNVAAAHLLLDRGAPVGGVPNPLWGAARAGDAALVGRLLSSGADVDEPGPLGETALAVAAGRGDLSMVETLLAHGAPVNTRERQALRAAVATGSVAVARRLLAAGAVPTWSDSNVWVEAAPHLSAELASVLGTTGVDPDTPDILGRSALDLALARGDEASARVLMAAGARLQVGGARREPVMVRLAMWDSKVGCALAQKLGAGLEDRTATGETALLRALAWDRLDLAEQLVQAGARLDAVDMRGRGVGEYAAGRSAQAVRWVSTHGVALTAGTWAAAIASRDTSTWEELRIRAPLPDGADAVAAWRAVPDSSWIPRLRTLGVPIEARDGAGRTALLAAIVADDEDSVGRLLGAGADVTARDPEGRTALDLAAAGARQGIVERLLTRRAPAGAVPLTLPPDRGDIALYLVAKGIPAVAPGAVRHGLAVESWHTTDWVAVDPTVDASLLSLRPDHAFYLPFAVARALPDRSPGEWTALLRAVRDPELRKALRSRRAAARAG